MSFDRYERRVACEPKKIYRPERNDGEDLDLAKFDRWSAQNMVWQFVSARKHGFRRERSPIILLLREDAW